MKKIHKYTLQFDGESHIISLPEKHKILSVGHQKKSLVFWVEFEIVEKYETKPFVFKICTTGETIDDNLHYIGTTFFDTVNYRPLVLHLYQEVEDENISE